MADMPKKRKRQKQYRLSDLKAMVEQLGGRLHLDIYPAELEAEIWKRRRDTPSPYDLVACRRAAEQAKGKKP